tara:strand:+ start:1650 stop:2270 length:621 start_codon:yes stop_codon:yes gene_type:complete
MTKVSRTFRIDRSLSEAMDKIYARHGDNTYHIENALAQYGPIKAVVNPGVPVVKKAVSVPEDERPFVLQKYVATTGHFDEFWASGIRKVNKKKAQSLFNNILKKQGDKDAFTARLALDIANRLTSNQLGFAEMHPTTYLNGERWNDEVMTNDQSHQRLNQPRKSLSERTADQARQIWAECEAEEAGERVMDKNGSIIPAKMEFIGG